MRRFWAFFLAGAILLPLCGCGSSSSIGPLSIAFTTSTGSVPGGTNFVFSVTTQNDTQNRGVNYVLAINEPSNGATTTPCTSACGTLGTPSNVVTANGPNTYTSVTSVTYSAPLLPPNPNNLILTATANANSSITLTDTFSVGAPQIVVHITNKITNIAPGAAPVTLNATVQFDTTNAGVTWALTAQGSSCSPACGTFTNPQPFSIVYTPPTTLPAAPNNTPTITATSVANTSISDFDDIRIQASTLPISVSILNPFTQITAGSAGVTIDAQVDNDVADQGVTWSLSPAALTGSLGAELPLSVIYTPPNNAPEPPNNTPIITATSVADPTKSASFTFTIEPAAFAFAGSYVFWIRGHDDSGYRMVTAGSLTSDGAGKITSGEMDLNASGQTPENIAPVTGSYDCTSSDPAGESLHIEFNAITFPGRSIPITFDARFKAVSVRSSSASSRTYDFSTGEISGKLGALNIEGEIHRQDPGSALITNFTERELHLGIRSDGSDHSGLLGLQLSLGVNGQIERGFITRLVAFESDGDIHYTNQGSTFVKITGDLATFDAGGRAVLTVFFDESGPARYAVYAESPSDFILISVYPTDAPQSGDGTAKSPDSE